MSKTRLLVACCITACLAVPLASPAVAQEADCPSGWADDFVLSLVPAIPAFAPVEFDEETITIRGDLVAAEAVSLVEHYLSRTEELVACLQVEVERTATPYRDCVEANAAPILAAPDPVARYVEVGTDLVVKVHYARAVEDVRLIFNCNEIVRYGD